MDASRQKAEELAVEVLDLSPPERETALEHACSGDAELRASVEELLREYSRAADYFDGLASSVFGGAPAVVPSVLEDPYNVVGQTIEQYHVEDPIGAGGMGVVYRARDTRLQRTVALKFLPPALEKDPVAVERFVQEAQAASALDHPNICTVYEVAEYEQSLFIVMAYCEGDTLKRRLVQGPLPVEEAVSLARQIASGLAEAHARGIVHRDVKPGNVLVSPRGQVKLVDFGLAKLSDQAHLTRSGATLGTVSYMSPEQARGGAIDARSDVWSTGVVMYEMLSGIRPFTGDNDVAILSALLHEDPTPIGRVRPDVPPVLRAVVGRCLSRDLNRRYRDAGALSEALEEAAVQLRLSDRPAHAPPSRSRRRLVTSVLPALAVAALLFWFAADRLSDARAISRLAVLPIESNDADPRTRELLSGLAGAISRSLADEGSGARPRVQIIPASEVHAQRVSNATEAGRVLGADRTARVRLNVDDDRTVVRLELSDARSRRAIARDSFVTASLDPIALHQGVSERLRALLRVRQARSSPAAAASTQDPDALEHYLRGLSFLDFPDQESGIDEAIGHFMASRAEDARFARAYAGLCEAYWRKFSLGFDNTFADAALQNCRRALTLDPDLSSTYVMQALIETETGASEAALASVEAALARDPRSPEAHRMRGRILMGQGELAQAEQAYLSALQIDSRAWRGYSALGNLYLRAGRYEDAVTAFRRITVVAPDFVWGYLNLGAAYMNMGDFAEARQAWEQGIAVRRDYDLVSNLGTALFMEGRLAEAVAAYEEALALNDRDYRIWGNLAAAARLLPGGAERAESAYARAAEMARLRLALNPDDPTVLVHLAAYEAHLGTPESAIARLAQVASSNPADASVFFGMADAYEQLGERDDAFVWLERALTGGLQIFWVEDNPSMAALRQDPRYAALRQSIYDN